LNGPLQGRVELVQIARRHFRLGGRVGVGAKLVHVHREALQHVARGLAARRRVALDAQLDGRVVGQTALPPSLVHDEAVKLA